MPNPDPNVQRVREMLDEQDELPQRLLAAEPEPEPSVEAEHADTVVR